MKFSKNQIKSFIEIGLIVILFIFFSYLVQRNIDILEKIMKENVVGMMVYIFIGILAIVIAPISNLPLLPVASNLWGWFFAGILTLIAWTLGSIFAFIIARKYGAPLVGKIIPLNKMAKFEKRVPKESLFLDVVFLRMIIPADILSYFLGLFSKIDFKNYVLATIIGLTPMVFLFTYVGRLHFYYQIIILMFVGMIFMIGIIVRKIAQKTLII